MCKYYCLFALQVVVLYITALILLHWTLTFMFICIFPSFMRMHLKRKILSRYRSHSSRHLFTFSFYVRSLFCFLTLGCLTFSRQYYDSIFVSNSPIVEKIDSRIANDFKEFRTTPKGFCCAMYFILTAESETAKTSATLFAHLWADLFKLKLLVFQNVFEISFSDPSCPFFRQRSIVLFGTSISYACSYMWFMCTFIEIIAQISGFDCFLLCFVDLCVCTVYVHTYAHMGFVLFTNALIYFLSSTSNCS